MTTMNTTYYIDPDTRIRFRYAASLLSRGHVLERRRRFLFFSWWAETASTYEQVIPASDTNRLVGFLLRKERRKYHGFSGYPQSPSGATDRDSAN